MRSQVQVLAGPPPITAGHSAAGAAPGALVACLGRAGAARPSPPAGSVALRGPSTRASGATTTTDSSRAPSPGRHHPAGAGTSRCRPLPCPGAAASHRRPAPVCPPVSGRARPPPPEPNPARSAADAPRWPTRPPQRRPHPGGSSSRRPSRWGRGRPHGTRPVVQVAWPHRPGANATVGLTQRRRRRQDSRAGTRRLDIGRADVGRPDTRQLDSRTLAGGTR
jgi:hypothetical protein